MLSFSESPMPKVGNLSKWNQVDLEKLVLTGCFKDVPKSTLTKQRCQQLKIW